MNDPYLELRGVSKYFSSPQKGRIRAVEDLSLIVKKGEFISLVGPSGCGKTTTLRMIAGFERQDEGEIYVDGGSLDRLPPYRRNTPMVFQSYALFPHMTVFENIAYGLKVRGKSRTTVRHDVFLACQTVNLTGLEGRYPRELSGGQQQRVALARVLVLNPKIILFDEPLSNLDNKLRSQTRSEIKRVQQMLGITALYVTHDQSEALSLSDRVVVMNRGRIVQTGSPLDIYNHPASPFVSDFIGGANFLSARVEERRSGGLSLRVGNHGFSVSSESVYTSAVPGEEVLLGIKPEAVEIHRQGPGIPGQVEACSFLGATTEVKVEVLNSFVTAVHANSASGAVVFQPGEQVFLRPKEGFLRAYDGP